MASITKRKASKTDYCCYCTLLLAYSGNFNRTPLLFEDFYINGLCLRINGGVLLSKPYKVDFTNGKYSIWYGGHLRNVGNQNESIGISTRNYMKHYVSWLFDMTPDNYN